MILSGAKTQTRRPARPQVKEGGRYTLRAGNRPTGRSITVTRVYTQRLGDLSPEEVRAEGFSTLEEFRGAWVSIYGSWRPEETVYVVEFRLDADTEMFKERTSAS